MKKQISVLLISLSLFACNKQPVASGSAGPSPAMSPAATPTPVPTATASETATPKIYFTLGTDIGPNVNKKFAQDALDIINKHVASGCLHDKFMLRSLTSLKNVEGLS